MLHTYKDLPIYWPYRRQLKGNEFVKKRNSHSETNIRQKQDITCPEFVKKYNDHMGYVVKIDKCWRHYTKLIKNRKTVFFAFLTCRCWTHSFYSRRTNSKTLHSLKHLRLSMALELMLNRILRENDATSVKQTGGSFLNVLRLMQFDTILVCICRATLKNQMMCLL